MQKFLVFVFVLAIIGCAKPQLTTIHGKSVAHWVQALQDRDPATRRKAVECLGNVGAADPAAIPALIGALKDRDAQIRAAATLALLKIGPAAAEAAPALINAQKDKDAKVREYAAKALEKIQGSE